MPSPFHPCHLQMFVTKSGSAFNDVTFVQYWQEAMKTAPSGLPYHPPSKFRTIFVEEFTAHHHMEPELWDGAAVIMGNSVEQWQRTYNPSRKRRMAQQVVNTMWS